MKQKKYSIKKAVVGALVLSAGIACNVEPTNTNESQLATLDDLARNSASAALRTCRASESVAIPSERIAVQEGSSASFEKKSLITESVRSYLTSIPTVLQKTFLKMNGAILLVDQVDEWCGAGMNDPKSANFVAPAARQLSSCFVNLVAKSPLAAKLPEKLRALTDNGKSAIIIIHKTDASDIHASGVRTFGFLHAQFYPRLAALESGSYGLARPESEGLVKSKIALTKSFLADINQSKTFDLTALESLLGKGSSVKIRANLWSGKQDPLAGVSFLYPGDAHVPLPAETVATRARRFYDYVFADAFDSMYCNTETKASIKTNFPESFAEFSRISNHLLAGAEQFLKLDEGLSLAAPAGADTSMPDELSSHLFPNNPNKFTSVRSVNDVEPTNVAEKAIVSNTIAALDRSTAPVSWDPLLSGSGIYPTSASGPNMAGVAGPYVSTPEIGTNPHMYYAAVGGTYGAAAPMASAESSTNMTWVNGGSFEGPSPGTGGIMYH